MIEISTVIQTTLQAIKQVKEISEKWQDTQVRALLISSIDQMQDVKEAALTLREENLGLKAELSALKEKQRLKDTLAHKFDSYWTNKGDGLMDGPFCSKCFDDEGKTVRLQSSHTGRHNYTCPKCKNGVWVPDEEEKKMTGRN